MDDSDSTEGECTARDLSSYTVNGESTENERQTADDSDESDGASEETVPDGGSGESGSESSVSGRSDDGSTTGGDGADGSTGSDEPAGRHGADDPPELWTLPRKFNTDEDREEDRVAVAETVQVFKPRFQLFYVRSQAEERPRQFHHVYVGDLRLSLTPGSSATLVPPSDRRLRCRLRGEHRSRVDGRELAVLPTSE